MKLAVLLSPFRLSAGEYFVDALHIEKKNGVPGYDIKPIKAADLEKNLPGLAARIREQLAQFSYEALGKVETAIGQQLGKQRAGVDRDQYMRKAMQRHVHQLLDSLLPVAPAIKWYCQKPHKAGKHYVLAPCTLLPQKPVLFFDVVKEEDGGLNLLVSIEAGGLLFRQDAYTRNAFLLERNNQFSLLSLKDAQTLDWLLQNPPLKYTHDSAAFAEHIVSPLEENYTVNRNGLFEEKVLEATPVNRVLLSELNNAFLMLTPQWLYDGFLIEGNYTENHEIKINGQITVIRRNKALEDGFIKILQSLNPKFAMQRNGYYYLPFSEAQKGQWFPKTYHRLLDEGIEVTGMDLLKHFRYSPHKVHTTLTMVEQKGTKAVMQLQVMFGKEAVPLNLLQKALYAGQKAILLKDGSLGMLPEDWQRQYAPMIKHSKIDKQQIEVSRFLALSETAPEGETRLLQPLITADWWRKWQQWQAGAEPLYPLPGVISATLRPYQQKGFEWLAMLSEAGAGACLADDMGLGKSLQTICFLAWCVQRDPEAKHLIVCPASLLYNWQQELQKFAPALQTQVYHGAKRDKKDLELPGIQIIISSYGTVRYDAEAFLSIQFGTVVLDESHTIKNPQAQVTTAVSRLNAASRITLSGTPVVNNTFDLYAQLDFAIPGLLGGKEFFKREYADAIDRYGDEDKKKALQKLTAPFILRRTKELVAPDLPQKTESIRWCMMGERQQYLYNNIKDQVRSSIFTDIESKGLQSSKLAVLQGMMKLRQVCNSALMLPREEQEGCTDSVKTAMLMEELQNIIPGHKALVFSQFTSMLDLLAESCRKNKFNFFHFDGSTPPAKRAEMVKAFQEEDSDTHLFLISLKAGNTGLNLTAADYVFLFDPWWNTAVEQQAIDRTHRIGQQKSVFAYRLVCKNTIEEKIIALQQKKKQLAEDLVNAEEAFVKNLSEDDVKWLFS